MGCPEGHTLCCWCYVAELYTRNQCPICNYPTDSSRLQRCRPLEGLIGQLRTRCTHSEQGEEGEGVDGGGGKRAKWAKLQPAESISIDGPSNELGLGTNGNGSWAQTEHVSPRKGADGGGGSARSRGTLQRAACMNQCSAHTLRWTARSR